MKIYAIVLAAGKGTRMKSQRPKVVHDVLYKPMINHVVDELKLMGVDETIVVVGHEAQQVEAILDNVEFVYQKEQLGTGHAVLQAKDILKDKEGITLVLNGDAPLIRKETLQGLVEFHMNNHNQATVMSADCDVSNHYGRIIKEDGQVIGIVEYKDLQEYQMDVTEMNTGEYCFDNQKLFEALDEVTNENAQNEYYLTDIVNGGAEAFLADNEMEFLGVNDRVQLSFASKILWKERAESYMKDGVSIIDPSSVYIDLDVIIGKDTMIYPNVFIENGSRIEKNVIIRSGCRLNKAVIEENVEIKDNSLIEDSFVGAFSSVGPMAHLRPGSHLAGENKIGNFVELKKATMGKGSKASHLTYLGDSELGENVNIGCGTITCNYDGFNKYKTIIGNNVFVGSDTQFVAPVTVGDNVLIAAGSTITKDINTNDLAIARTQQLNIENKGKEIMEINKAKKNSKGK